VFVFLAGTGSYLQIARGKSRSELSRFLISRGLWLIVLEVTVVRFGVVFNFDLQMLAFLQVIWVIGVSMIVLAVLIYLPLSVIGAFGVLMIALHNLLDRPPASEPPVPPTLGVKIGMLLHQQGGFTVGSENHLVFVVYPLIPWVGVMAAGYAFGALYRMDSHRRKRILLALGGSASLLFVIIRLINRYGDPATWSPQESPLFTLLSFLNTTKYPPSLLYLLMTLGPALIFLALAEVNIPVTGSTQSSGSWLRRAFVTFGRVPLFFYFLQWYTAHLISIGLHFAFGKPTDWLFQTPLDWFSKPHPGIGFNLAVVYAAWFTGLLVIYPLCKWFAGVKARRKDWWLSYL
jgi:uncharacterized membrane protein